MFIQVIVVGGIKRMTQAEGVTSTLQAAHRLLNEQINIAFIPYRR